MPAFLLHALRTGLMSSRPGRLRPRSRPRGSGARADRAL